MMSHSLMVSLCIKGLEAERPETVVLTLKRVRDVVGHEYLANRFEDEDGVALLVACFNERATPGGSENVCLSDTCYCNPSETQPCRCRTGSLTLWSLDSRWFATLHSVCPCAEVVRVYLCTAWVPLTTVCGRREAKPTGTAAVLTSCFAHCTAYCPNAEVMREFLRTAQHLLKFERTREGLLMVRPELGRSMPGPQQRATARGPVGLSRKAPHVYDVTKHQVPHTHTDSCIRHPHTSTGSRSGVPWSRFESPALLPINYTTACSKVPIRPFQSHHPRHSSPAPQRFRAS